MKAPSFALAALACASLAACDRGAQSLPFDSDSDAPVTRTLPAEGGTVSSAAGASLRLPAGAVAAGTAVTLTPVAAPGSPGSGTAAFTRGFRIDPAGLALGAAGRVDLGIAKGDDAWLASLVVLTPTGVVEDGEGSVDLNTGLLYGELSTFGTVVATVPEPAAVLQAIALGTAPAAPKASTAAAGTTRALRGDCGRPGKRCDGLVVEVSPNLLETVDLAAVLFPKVGGEIRISGTAASGALTLTAPLRVRLASRANATTVHSRITAAATAQSVVAETPGRLTISNVRVRGESGHQSGETVATLVVEYSGAQAWIRLEHDFQATLASGAREDVTVAARVPLVRVQ